jgi:alkanesulfonate monooxygenase SsuD/methylene tetrahydromethanopterin reductase-like flavin-dependent oxidoreductase (luciferase family)
MTEAIQIIRKLWEGSKKEKENSGKNSGFIDFNGQYFKIKNAKLYTPQYCQSILLRLEFPLP